MNKYIKLGVLLISLIVSSCNLDTQPTNEINTGQALGSVESLKSSLKGLYLDISIKGEYTGSSASIVSRGLDNTNNIINDIMGGTFVLNTDDFRIFPDYNFEMHIQGSRNSDRTLTFWTFNYAIIRRANEILKAANEMLTDATEVEAKDINQMIGEIYGIRALIYHTLNVKYAFRYTSETADKTLSVPIVLKITDSPMGDVAARNTQAEVVDRIKLDIADALEHLALGNPEVNSPYTFNATAVKVLKARLEMYTEDYVSALATAEDIILTSGKSIMGAAEYEKGFNNALNPEWIFASNQSGDYTAAWASFMNSMAVNYPTSYGPISIDLSYIFGINGDVDLMPEEEPYEGGLPNTIGLTIRPVDSRLKLFVTDSAATIAANIANDRNYYEAYKDRGVESGAQKKYVQVGSAGAADVISMRLAEVYYIAAEAAAYLKQDEVARTYLLATISPYDKEFSTTESGERLKTMIANYKAVDMFGEGKRFEDIKRRGTWVYRIQKYNPTASYTPTRQYKSTPPYVTRQIPYMDVLTYPIPKKAKDANPLLENNF